MTLSAQVTITHQRNPFFLPSSMANKLRRNNALAAVFQIIGSLAVFYLPYHAVCLYESLCAAVGAAPRTDPAVKSVCFALITGSAVCNGLLYGIKNKLLKKTYQNYRRKMMTKCEVNQEIQARTPSACGSRRPSLTPVSAAAHKPAAPAAAALLRRSSDASLTEPGELRRQAPAAGSANGLVFGNYYADAARFGDNGGIRRCYSSSTGDDRSANQNAFVRRILRDSSSRRSPRILITRAMSEENESHASEPPPSPPPAPDTPVGRRPAHVLSSSSVTLYIDERSADAAARHSDYSDDDRDDASPAYSSLSSSNDDSSGCCAAHECTRLTRSSP